MKDQCWVRPHWHPTFLEPLEDFEERYYEWHPASLGPLEDFDEEG
jgi:hypothetical protein